LKEDEGNWISYLASTCNLIEGRYAALGD